MPLVPLGPLRPLTSFSGDRSTNAEDLAAVDPDLHAYHTESRVGLRETVVDISAKRMKRKPPVEIPFRARYLSSAQTAGDAHFDPLSAEALGAVDRLAHGAAE